MCGIAGPDTENIKTSKLAPWRGPHSCLPRENQQRITSIEAAS